MLSPYERLLLAYLGKQPDQITVAIPPFPVLGVPKLEMSADRANPNFLRWDKETRIRKSIEFNVNFAKRFPDLCVLDGIGSGGHGDKSLHLAQILAPKLGRKVFFKESSKGGYTYSKPLIEDLSTFSTDELYVPDLSKEPDLERVLEVVEMRLELEDEAYADLEEHVANGVKGWASTRCVEDIIDQGLVSYRQFLIGMKLWPDKIHKLCEVTTEYVIEQLKHLEGAMGKITKLSIADHCTTFMSWKQAEEFWVPYVRRVNEAFRGAIHIYHNEGQIIHLAGLILKAGFDVYQIGPETDLVEFREVVGNKLALFGNIDPVYTLPSGTPEEVEDACKQAITKGSLEGGFILSTGGGPPRNGAPLRNLEAMIKSAEKYGKYSLSA
ncbi:MAG: uroporphyrinogen decarboxylase family protein [Candidatus Bathyarchaeia archaeon]